MILTAANTTLTKHQKSLMLLGVLVTLIPAGARCDQRRTTGESEVTSIVAQELLLSVGTAAVEFTHSKLNQVVNDLLQARDRRLIPFFKEQFEAAQSFYESLPSAAFLTYLGAEDAEYWKHVYKTAKEAIESGMPEPYNRGLAVGGSPAEETLAFQQWRAERSMSQAEASQLQQRYYLATFMLGATLDPRATDLLLQGLEVDNSMIILGSIQALARLQDNRAVEPIIHVLESGPESFAKVAAVWLLYFDDPRAQSAAARLVNDEAMLEGMAQQIRTNGVKGIYGY